MRPAHWLPPVLWMGVIMLLSTDTGSAAHTSELLLPLLHWLLPWASPGDLAAIHGLVRKGAHLSEYAILAALWYRAFTRGRRLTPPTAGSRSGSAWPGRPSTSGIRRSCPPGPAARRTSGSTARVPRSPSSWPAEAG